MGDAALHGHIGWVFSVECCRLQQPRLASVDEALSAQPRPTAKRSHAYQSRIPRFCCTVGKGFNHRAYVVVFPFGRYDRAVPSGSEVSRHSFWKYLPGENHALRLVVNVVFCLDRERGFVRYNRYHAFLRKQTKREAVAVEVR